MTRACEVCGGSLEGRRQHARHCSGACRAEGSRLARLEAGEAVDGFVSLGDRQVRQRQRKRTERSREV